jgi:hypothetical protein
MENMFIHHVYFWLNNPTSSSDRDTLIAGLRKLSSVKSIHQCHIGVPANTNRPVIDSTYAVSLLLTFKNDADQASYQTDPDHLAFVAECKSLWSKVIVYDSVDAQ